MRWFTRPPIVDRAGTALVVVAIVIAGCTSADDAVTSRTDPVASVPVVATPSPVESQRPIETSGATTSPADAASTSSASTSGDIETKDVRTVADGVVGDGVRPEGFTTIAAEVTSADGELCTVCLWLADIADERARGLMGVTDLGDAVGMAFVFDEPGEGAFVMIGTPTPLSIGWFDADGGYVSAVDMEPCAESDSSQCDRYRAEAPYLVAIEMFQGELDAIGIGPGSIVQLVAGTESPDCGAFD